MEVGEIIRKYRKAKYLTQTELATEVGVSKGSVINWENGRTFPNYYVAKQLADFFNIDLSVLGYDSTASNSANSRTRPAKDGFIQANRIANQLIELFASDKLSESDKEAIMLSIQQAYLACKQE